jgi:hypothetical protein
MISESKHDILENNRFTVTFNGYDTLGHNTSYIKYDSELKQVFIELYYTREVFRLNKVIQKGRQFSLKYIVHSEDESESEIVLNGTVVIDSLSFNLSRESNHQPTITLYCSCA